MFIHIENIQILILSGKMHSLEISYLQKIKMSAYKTGIVEYKIIGKSLR